MARLIGAQETVDQAAEWDRRLRAWPAASLLQSYAWGSVQERSGWGLRRLEVGTAKGTLPVLALFARVWPGGPLRVYVPRGPACAAGDQDSFSKVVNALQALGTSLGALVVEMEVPWEQRAVGADHPLREFTRCRARQPLATSVVDLRPEPEQILAGFHSKTRYNVRLAERRGVDVGPVTLAELNSCVRATERRQGIHLPSERHLGTVLEALGDQALALGARVGDEVVAAVLLARFSDQVIYLYGGGTERHRQFMPNHLLHWRAMMLARQAGCRSYDLWGIPEDDRPDHPWHGLAQFKLGFGGNRVDYAGCWQQSLRPLGGRIMIMADGVRSKLRRPR